MVEPDFVVEDGERVDGVQPEYVKENYRFTTQYFVKLIKELARCNY